ncbi:hypothetical protein ACS0TY_026702 [Phlomoides rotata]
MDLNGNRVEVGREDTVCIDEDETEMVTASTMCLIGKVLHNKPFNALSHLETMKKAMNPPLGFTAREIGKNLFSFQLRSTSDMNDILAREPWLFENNIVA